VNPATVLAELEQQWEAGTLTPRDQDRLVALSAAVQL